MGDQHDHDRVGARKMLGLAARAFTLPAAVVHRGAGAAVGAEAVALVPGHHRFRHRDRRELLRRHHALHRHAAQFGDRDVARGRSNFSAAGGGNAHAEYGGAITQSQKDRAGIGAEFQRFLDASAGPAGRPLPASPPASRVESAGVLAMASALGCSSLVRRCAARAGKPPTFTPVRRGLRMVRFSYEGGTIDEVFKPGTEPGSEGYMVTPLRRIGPLFRF